MFRWLLVLFLALTLLVVLSTWRLAAPTAAPLAQASFALVRSSPVASSSAALSMRGRPSLSPVFVNRVLAAAHSPAAGLGSLVYARSLAYGMDDAPVLGFFGNESLFATRGMARVTHSWGNLRCFGYPTCSQGYRLYPSFAAGLEDFLRLLAFSYFPQGETTVETIIPRYAPSSDGNNVAGYIAAVHTFVSAWRAGRVLV